MPILPVPDDDALTDDELRATPVVVTGSVTTTPPVAVSRVTEYVRYADAGPTGISAHGTHTITAGKKSYSIAVIAAASEDSPTLDGVAIPANTVLEFEAPPNDTLEAASLVTVAGDEVLFVSVT